ncbi:MAG: enamine deaminase RidA [Gammaproteobacteria bacterium]|nr:MAG: enamine deaminase RidA [Gammaproteobacteria bacterium]
MTSHQAILPEGWPKPNGYANAILAAKGRTLFLAGQIGWTPDGKFHSEELLPQFEQALKNIVDLVSAAGGKPSDICKMTCYCTDRDQYLENRKQLGIIWKSIMGKHYPCMSMLFVSDLLDHPAIIEIEATAVISD